LKIRKFENGFRSSRGEGKYGLKEGQELDFKEFQYD